MKGCSKAAGWVVCCFSSGCPCGRASSGSALPAAESAAAAEESAEGPPEERRTNTLLDHKRY